MQCQSINSLRVAVHLFSYTQQLFAQTVENRWFKIIILKLLYRKKLHYESSQKSSFQTSVFPFIGDLLRLELIMDDSS